MFETFDVSRLDVLPVKYLNIVKSLLYVFQRELGKISTSENNLQVKMSKTV